MRRLSASTGAAHRPTDRGSCASELAGLDVGDLTIKRGIGVVRVNRTRRKVRGGWETSTPKSRASNGTVPLDAWLAEMLGDYLRDEHPNGSDPNAPLFPNPKIRGLLTFATLQLGNGRPDRYLQVSRWLGHASPGVTLRVNAYVILWVPEISRVAADLVLRVCGWCAMIRRWR
jgi:integrase